MFTGITGTDDCEEDGGQHADHAQSGSQSHISDEDAVEHRTDDGGSRGLLGNFIRRGGNDVALQGLVVAQNIHHIFKFEPFSLADAFEVFRLVIGRDTDADKDNTDKGQPDAKPCGNIQEVLVETTTHGRHNFGVNDDVQHHRSDIVECRLPYADGGALFGIVGHKSREGLGSHIDHCVSDDIDHVKQQEHRNTVTFAGKKVEHAQNTGTLDDPAQQHQRANLTERRIDTVIHEGEQRIGNCIKNAGKSQKTTDNESRNSITDAGGVTGKPD